MSVKRLLGLGILLVVGCSDPPAPAAPRAEASSQPEAITRRRIAPPIGRVETFERRSSMQLEIETNRPDLTFTLDAGEVVRLRIEVRATDSWHTTLRRITVDELSKWRVANGTRTDTTSPATGKTFLVDSRSRPLTIAREDGSPATPEEVEAITEQHERHFYEDWLSAPAEHKPERIGDSFVETGASASEMRLVRVERRPDGDLAHYATHRIERTTGPTLGSIVMDLTGEMTITIEGDELIDESFEGPIRLEPPAEGTRLAAQATGHATRKQHSTFAMPRSSNETRRP